MKRPSIFFIENIKIFFRKRVVYIKKINNLYVSRETKVAYIQKTYYFLFFRYSIDTKCQTPLTRSLINARTDPLDLQTRKFDGMCRMI